MSYNDYTSLDGHSAKHTDWCVGFSSDEEVDDILSGRPLFSKDDLEEQRHGQSRPYERPGRESLSDNLSSHYVPSLLSPSRFKDIQSKREKRQNSRQSTNEGSTEASSSITYVSNRRNACIVALIGQTAHFKGIIDMCKDHNTSTAIVFNSQGFSLISVNGDLVMYSVEIYQRDLLYYRFDCVGEGGQALDEAVISLDISIFYNALKSIDSKKKICFYFDDVCRSLVISSDGDHLNCSSTYVPSTIIRNPPAINPRGYDDRDLVISVEDFIDVCKQAISSRCKHLNIKMREKRFIFVAYDKNDQAVYDNKKVSGTFEYDDDFDDLEEAFHNIEIDNRLTIEVWDPATSQSRSVPMKTLRCFLKLKKVCCAGTSLRFISDERLPMVISCIAGSLGRLRIYINRLEDKQTS